MADRKRIAQPRSWTPSQVVAHNMARARRLRGWTQEATAERLSAITGSKWTAVTVAQAESSIGGSRVRQFTANELVGLARTFDVPVSWFFLPPDPGEGPDRLDAGGPTPLSWEQLAVIVGGHAENFADFAERLGRWADGAWRDVGLPAVDRLPGTPAVLQTERKQPVTAQDVALAAVMGAIRLQFGPRDGGPLPADTLAAFSSNLHQLQLLIDTIRNYSPSQLVRPDDVEAITRRTSTERTD